MTVHYKKQLLLRQSVFNKYDIKLAHIDSNGYDCRQSFNFDAYLKARNFENLQFEEIALKE